MTRGVCGNDSSTDGLQDTRDWTLKGLSYWALRGRQVGLETGKTGLFVAEGLFSTLANVKFDAERIFELIQKALKLCAAFWKTDKGLVAIEGKGMKVSPFSTEDQDLRSLKEFLVYSNDYKLCTRTRGQLLRQALYNRLFVWPRVKHIPNRTDNTQKDFSEVIEKALCLGNAALKNSNTQSTCAVFRNEHMILE